MKQSNMKLGFDLSRKKEGLVKTRNQSMENNHICQRFAARHGLIVTNTKQSQLINESTCVTSANQSTKLTHQIQETNINTTIIDILEKSPSDCPLTTRFLQERIDKHLQKDKKPSIISSETKQNLNKLQQITDDVKLLTKQLELSTKLNKNNHSISPSLDERLLGEICYQLERRILILIFSKSKQLYGYSLRYLPLIIEHEQNKHDHLIYKNRFLQIEKSLLKLNFRFNYHSMLTFSFINKFGIYSDYQWLKTNAKRLSDINQIQTYCYSLLSKEFHQDVSILLKSLELISNFDGKPLFYW